MKIWTIAPWLTAEAMVELAIHADALGFEGIMGADHGFVPQVMGKGSTWIRQQHRDHAGTQCVDKIFAFCCRLKIVKIGQAVE